MFILDMLKTKRAAVMTFIFAAFSLGLYEMVDIKLMAFVGLAWIAFNLSDMITNLIFNGIPRRLIDNCDTKAVFITGNAI